jgi:uncharacterized protein DUF3943
MKKIAIFSLLILLSAILFAQVPPATDTVTPSKGNVKDQLKKIKEDKVIMHSDADSNGTEPRKTGLIDTTKTNKYADLLNDDPEYNKKYPIWVPAVEVVMENAILNTVDRTVLNLEFSKVDPSTWQRTLKAGLPWGDGWMWDQDRFGNNFLSHPMTGAFYFNAARANGYNFWASAPFVLAGSYMWKIFGENGPPEREDLINTTFDGIALGEITYRISSNILDDRSTGVERVFRELAAGLVNPIRGVNRLLQGKSFKRTNKEVYQKEPINITFYSGLHMVNTPDNELLSGTGSLMLNIQLNYGNPFEVRKRKPFDYFKFRTELNFYSGRKIVDNILGYGILLGKNMQAGKFSLLFGGFQYYDYYDTKSFELSTIAFGPGLMSKLPLSQNSNLYTNIHLGLVPFAGSSVGIVTDTAQFRDYRFAYGLEGKIESAVNLGDRAMFYLNYYYYFMHAFNNTGKSESQVGTLGNNFISIIRPKITLQIYKNLNIGYEESIYINDHYQDGFSPLHSTIREQRIFLMFYWEDPQRRGHYNL